MGKKTWFLNRKDVLAVSSDLEMRESIYELPYFSYYKTHFAPKIWEENGGVSYSLNVAYLACYRISALNDVTRRLLAKMEA